MPSIKLAETGCPDHDQDPEQGRGGQVNRLASGKRLCGAKIGRILAGSVTVISVWIILILIIHLNIKVDRYELFISKLR